MNRRLVKTTSGIHRVIDNSTPPNGTDPIHEQHLGKPLSGHTLRPLTQAEADDLQSAETIATE